MKRRARERTLHAVGVLLCMLLACGSAFALDPNLDVSQYAHKSWTVHEGFFKGSVYSIVQTPDGYLWLGTEFGLLRFDGVRAVAWQPPPGQHLPSSNVGCLFAAPDGTLWIGTRNGLASWKGGKLTEYPELSGQFVFAVLQDREGTVWVGSIGVPPPGRLCAIRNGSVHCSGQDGSLGIGVSDLYEDHKGNLWAATRDGLWRWRPGTAQFYPLPGEPGGLPSVGEDDDGAILISARSGIGRLVNGKIMPYLLPGSPSQFDAQRLLRDRDGGLWIGTLDLGLIHVHRGRTDVFRPASGFSGGFVRNIFEDREGNIWVATSNGLDRFREFAVPTYNQNQGLLNSLVMTTLADRDGSVWLGTYDGLNKWKDGQISVYGDQNVNGAPVTGKQDGKISGIAPYPMLEDSRGRVWITTRREFGYIDRNRFTHVRAVPGWVVLSVTEDNVRNLWVSNQQLGLFRLSPENATQQIPWAALGHKDFAPVLAADPLQGGLWLGFFRGGVAYFKDGSVRASYGPADGLGEGNVNSFYFDRHGTLWAATEGGLGRFKNGHFATLTTKNGLLCDAVHWAMEDSDDAFWLYTPCGLVRIARSELDAWAASVDKDKDAVRSVRSTVFDSSDGVRAVAAIGTIVPKATKSTDGKLWFTSPDGVSVIDPRHIPFNTLPPPVHIEQITADHKTYESTPDSSGRVSLPARVRDLQIDYTALSLVAPEKVLFRYKLEGWDRDWQDAGTRRQAFYSNLPPRTYSFRVKACNNSGLWNEAGTSLNFSIDRAYYQTWWFRSLSVTVFLALLWALYRWRIHQFRSQEMRLRDVVDTIPAMAFVSRPDGYRTFVNKGWVEYTGMSVEQSLGSGWHAAIHPEDLKGVLGKWEEALATGKSMYYEARYRGAQDGQYRWFMVRVVEQRDKRGRIVKWFGTVTDIEDRKRAEQEREKLRQLEDDLAHINRVSILGEMAASLAHEIKQPITAAITSANTCVEWLAHEPPNLDRARAAATKMDKYGNRAAEMIDRIRSLYKKFPSQRELVDVNGIIEELLTLLKCEADRYLVAMRAELTTALPKIIVDRVQLQQVFMNLMLNAIEAMKESGGELMVTSQRQDSQLLFSVSDTGVGLPTEKVDQIFSAFFTTKPQGSGMGLAISRSIVESHGGRLWATANDGQGATFHFTLPTPVTESALVV